MISICRRVDAVVGESPSVAERVLQHAQQREKLVDRDLLLRGVHGVKGAPLLRKRTRGRRRRYALLRPSQ